MKYQHLGRTGLIVSELCLGSMQFGWTADESLSFKILTKAWDSGINFIDSADIYSNWAPGNPGGISEQIIGKWKRLNKIPRNQIVIATKVRGKMGEFPNNQGLSRAHIFKAVNASLKRLETDYIDLYQAHWFDDSTPIEETLAAFDDLIRQGKVRYIGASNFPAWRLMQALWISDKEKLSRFSSLQPHYNLAKRAEFESELADVCNHYGIGVIPYSPLAGGFLTGKYKKDAPLPDSVRANNAKNNYFNRRGWKIIDTLEQIGQKKSKTVSQIALAWLLANEHVSSAIIGPRTVEQLEDNLGVEDSLLEPHEIKKLNQVSDWRNN